MLSVRTPIQPISSPLLAMVEEAEGRWSELEQIELATEHVFHAGMYARTLRLPAGTVITGALVKIPTLLIVNGNARMTVNDGWVELSGYNVIPACGGRKQVFWCVGDVEMTMLFPTAAQTVEQAEEEFTDEADKLLSRRQEAQ
jgi:hypothetical protein